MPIYFSFKIKLLIEILFRNQILYIIALELKILKTFPVMNYKKKSLKNLNRNESYEEIDTRLASGWYVDSVVTGMKKNYKTKEVKYKIVKKSN